MVKSRLRYIFVFYLDWTWMILDFSCLHKNILLEPLAWWIANMSDQQVKKKTLAIRFAISIAKMQKQRRSEGNRSMGQLFYSFKKRRPVSYYFSYLFLLVDKLFQKIYTVSTNSYNFFSYYFNVVFHFYILLYFMCI